MFNSAVVCLFALLLSLTGCADAEARTQGRSCSVTAAPPKAIKPIAEAPAFTETAPITEPKTSTLEKTVTFSVSAYSSTPGQTDSTPCIAADNSNICRRKAAGELICASNAFKLGTKIHVDGLGTCVVADRMNRRYQAHVDWYVLDKATARKIGRKDRTVTVVSR